MSQKFIPNGDQTFATMAWSFATTIAKEPARFGVSDEDAAALSAAVQRYRETLQAARTGMRSQLATRTKEEARVVAERIIRRLANTIRASEAVEPIAKFTLGLRERAAKPKVLTVPNESPRLTFVRAHHEGNATPEHELSFTSQDFKSKPAGAVRVELFVDLIAPEAKIPEHPGQARGSRPFYLRSYTRSPIRLIPPMAGVPMRVVYWARWADTAGNVGPFSATAVGWVEGGSHYRQRLMHDHEARPMRVDVSIGEASSREQETVIVALLAAGQMSSGFRALPDEASREVRQLEGPTDEATSAAA